jgi:hypothetical protein
VLTHKGRAPRRMHRSDRKLSRSQADREVRTQGQHDEMARDAEPRLSERVTIVAEESHVDAICFDGSRKRDAKSRSLLACTRAYLNL